MKEAGWLSSDFISLFNSCLRKIISCSSNRNSEVLGVSELEPKSSENQDRGSSRVHWLLVWLPRESQSRDSFWELD